MRFILEPSVRNANMASRSLPRFSTETPFLVTSEGRFTSARLTAFWRLTIAMSVSVPLWKVTRQE